MSIKCKMTRVWQTARVQFERLKDNTRVRQAAVLYLASFAGIPLSIVTSIVFTRFLGPSGYGDFAFLDSIFDFAKIIFPLGLFHAANRAMVINRDPLRSKQLQGAGIVLLFALFVIMALVLLLYGITDTNLASKGLDRFFLYLIPFGWIFLFEPYFNNVLHAENRIYELSAIRFLPKVITFMAALLIFFTMRDFEGSRLAVIWSVYLFAFLSIYIIVLIKTGFSFRHIRQSTTTILGYYRTYGVHLYSGSLVFAGALALSGILISYFSDDNTGVGFFALSLAISRPLALIPGVIATTWFRDFASLGSIPPRMTFLTSVMTLLTLILLYLLTGPFISFFYGESFLPLIQITYISGTGMALHGMAGFFTRFLEARGRGRAVRNANMLTGLSVFGSNLLLIPVYAEKGAAISLILSGFIYLAGVLFYYHRLAGNEKIHTFGRDK